MQSQKEPALTAKFALVNSGVNWNECPLSKIVNDIIAGQNKAAEAIGYLEKSAKQAGALNKSMADADQWIHGTDDNGNEAYYCQNGADNATLSVLDLPEEYSGLIEGDYKFAKYVVLNQNIDGYSANHGYVWYAVKATEVITDVIFAGYVLTRMVRLYQAVAGIINPARFVPEIQAEIGLELDVIPEAPAVVEEDLGLMARAMGILDVTIETGLVLAAVAMAIYLVFELFILQDYSSWILYINLSRKSFMFSPAYLDNVDPDHIPAPLDPSSKSNTLPAFQRFPKYDPNVGFKPDEPYAQMALFGFVNKHTVLEGLGTLLKFQDVAKPGNNFLSLYEVNRFEDNRQGIEFNYIKTDYKDYYDDNHHKIKSERIDTKSSDLRIIAQTNCLSGASKNIYKTVVVVLDAD